MYFQSFDGRLYTFAATCQYVLAKSRNSGKFTVTIQNAPCGAVSDLRPPPFLPFLFSALLPRLTASCNLSAV